MVVLVIRISNTFLLWKQLEKKWWVLDQEENMLDKICTLFNINVKLSGKTAATSSTYPGSQVRDAASSELSLPSPSPKYPESKPASWLMQKDLFSARARKEIKRKNPDFETHRIRNNLLRWTILKKTFKTRQGWVHVKTRLHRERHYWFYYVLCGRKECVEVNKVSWLSGAI